MSLIGSAKEFFGLGPYNDDEAYYDEPQYSESRSTAYGRDRGADRGAETAHARGYEPAASAPRRDVREAASRDYAPSIVTAAPRSYNDAKEIGEPFRDGDVVLMDLTDLESADAKRVIDFAAGLCFALRGQMHNLSRGLETDRRIFAITPEHGRFTKTELQRAAHLR
ncbi:MULTISPECIES: cell division protein SepF [unclassified Corynebacterium]|uniref:cell division protein SepF n=1 Tax=unclassified Corynebacterium TaxID=2624378 RepID=UPI002A912C36|nr:cell division protein SepF [Corynebacterium sp.]MDY5784893.1 cell division protein SepF [Corynebacterium sp.]